MGELAARLLGRVWAWWRVTDVLMVSLGAAGKTRILDRLAGGPAPAPGPQPALGVRELRRPGLRLAVWEASGEEALLLRWRHCFPGGRGLVFVVDAADPVALDGASAELAELLDQEDLLAQRAALLVYANKQDLPGALGPRDVQVRLRLDVVARGRSWLVQPASAVDGSGLEEGLAWLCHQLRFDP